MNKLKIKNKIINLSLNENDILKKIFIIFVKNN